MLAERKMARTFWAEVENWTIHVLNRSPTFVVKTQPPKEAWRELDS